MQTISNKEFTLDLNGHNIINAKLTALELGGSTNMTVQDTSTTASGMFSGGYTGIVVAAEATLTVESGTVKGGSNAVLNSGTVNIKGTAKLQRDAIFSINCETGSTVNMTGGTVFDIGTTESAHSYTVNVSGGEVENYVYATSVTGGTIKDLILIKGGEISNAAINGYIQWLDDTVPTLSSVRLGDNAYVKNEGYCFNSDKNTIVPSVAQVGSTKYETLQEAINATVTGDTVTLLADVDLGSSVSFYNKKDTSVCNLTFDLNGHTITSAIGDNGTVLAAREGLVIKNGAIVNTSESTNKKTSAICVTSKGTTTIENVTVTSKVSGVYICQLTSTGAEVVNVESGTFISGEYGVYIANPKGSTTKSSVETLNINGGTINGTLLAYMRRVQSLEAETQ